MSEETSLKKTAVTAVFALLPILELLGVEPFLSYINYSANPLSPFALGLLFAQLLCSLVFIKGEICPGQRGRLAKVHSLFGVAWLIWLILFGLNGWEISTGMIYLCGLIMTLVAFKQSKENPELRNKILGIGVVAGLLGSVLYFIQLANLTPTQLWGQYNPFTQMLLGIVLANIALVLSKNRLQGLIALLPFAMAIFLLVSVVFVLIVLVVAQSAVHFSNEFAVLLYFTLHLVIMAIVAIPILRKTKLDYFVLMLVYILTVTLPIWAGFAYLA